MAKGVKPNLSLLLSLSAQLSGMKCVQMVRPSHFPSTDLFSSCKTETLSPFPLPSLWSPPICVCESAYSGTSSVESGSVWPLVAGVCHCAWRPRAPQQCSLRPDLLYQADGHSTALIPLLFIRSSTDGHSGGFYLLAIVNKVVMNIDVQIALRDPTLSSFG